MEYHDISKIKGTASLDPATNPMTREDKLLRWAELLEGQEERWLRPLEDVEYIGRAARDGLRADDSPLAVAYEDEGLRAQGLKNDTLGHATEFFGLSDREAHHILCRCHYAGRMEGTEVARRVREAAKPTFANRLWASMTCAMLAAAAVSVLGTMS